MTLVGWLGNEIDPPVYVVTAATGEERNGCLAAFATQCSVDPILFVVFLSPRNATYHTADASGFVGVHAIPADRLDLAELFGGESGHDVEKLTCVPHREGPLGVPLIDDVPTWFVGRVVGRFRAGDHVGFVLEPVEGRARSERGLGLQAVRHITPGRRP